MAAPPLVPLDPPPPGDTAEDGLWAGRVTSAPGEGRHRRGRRRRWSYSAAAGVDDDGEEWLFAVAVVAVGPVRTAFALGRVGGERIDWTVDLRPVGMARVGHVPAEGASCGRDLHVGEHGEVALRAGGWTIDSGVVPDLPAVCATPTPRGGWNVTQKCAGETVTLQATTPAGRRVRGVGVGWRDWTSGRQDRSTTWEWAAGGAAGDVRVGWNVSTGMNGTVGEDVVWVDGAPHRLHDVAFAPVDELRGDWRLTARELDLSLAPSGHDVLARRRFGMASHYTKPWGRWTGTVRLPAGDAAVDGFGVAEHHEVTW